MPGFLAFTPRCNRSKALDNNSRAKLEIHPKRGLKMDMVTDKWIRTCVGIALVLVGLAVLALAITPAIHAIRWW
jgi:hypothetical protein